MTSGSSADATWTFSGEVAAPAAGESTADDTVVQSVDSSTEDDNKAKASSSAAKVAQRAKSESRASTPLRPTSTGSRTARTCDRRPEKSRLPVMQTIGVTAKAKDKEAKSPEQVSKPGSSRSSSRRSRNSAKCRKLCTKLFAGIRNIEDLVICLPLRIPLSNPGRTLAPWTLMEPTVHKARPRRGGETITSDLILIRYDTQHNCGHEVTSRVAFLICGVDIAEVGPDNNDKVVELIETMSDHRDRCLPQRGDQPTYAPDPRSGYYVNDT